MPLPFKQVDVITQKPIWGNPVAVVSATDRLFSEEMQRFASWTNLSETTFVLTPPTGRADYRLRIFSATINLPFAGRPTIGSAHAVIGFIVIPPLFKPLATRHFDRPAIHNKNPFRCRGCSDAVNAGARDALSQGFSVGDEIGLVTHG